MPAVLVVCLLYVMLLSPRVGLVPDRAVEEVEVMRWLKGFGPFGWDFIVGDDWIDGDLGGDGPA